MSDVPIKRIAPGVSGAQPIKPKRTPTGTPLERVEQDAFRRATREQRAAEELLKLRRQAMKLAEQTITFLTEWHKATIAELESSRARVERWYADPGQATCDKSPSYDVRRQGRGVPRVSRAVVAGEADCAGRIAIRFCDVCGCAFTRCEAHAFTRGAIHALHRHRAEDCPRWSADFIAAGFAEGFEAIAAPARSGDVSEDE